MSGRSLSRRLGKSEGYVRDRLNGTYEFSLADVENFALFIGLNPEEFVGAIDRHALEAELPQRSTPFVEAISLGELLAGGKSRSQGNVTPIGSRPDVAAPTEDDLQAAAKKKSRDRGEQPEAP